MILNFETATRSPAAALGRSAAAVQAGGRFAAANAARVARIQAFVEANLDDADLSARRCAKAVGISLRSLHLAMEGTPETFSEMLVRRRLARCRAMLARSSGYHSIADVAFACGFNSLSSFYRAFRREFGARPTELAARAA